MPKVPIQLKPKPKLCGHSKHLRQPQRCIRRYGPTTPYDLVEARKGHTQPDSELGLGDAKWAEKLLE